MEKPLENTESITYVERATGDIAIDATNFPDAEFRDYIIVNFDVDKDGILSSNEIANITEINVADNQNITSLVGIEHFPNLTNLRCTRTSITSLDVSKNPNLNTLWCNSTDSKGLNLSNNLKISIFSFPWDKLHG